MPKNNSNRKSTSYVSLIFGFVTSFIVLAAIYKLLSAFGIEERMNVIDRGALVSWRKMEFNPKRYFRLFYNISLIYIPLSTLFFSQIFGRLSFIKKIRFPKLPILKVPQHIHLLSKYTLQRRKVVAYINKYYLWILVGLLFIVLFNFGYLLETGIWVNYYHHNFIIAAINDLFAGKHLLVDTFSQYGMLLPFALYVIFRMGVHFSYMNLYLLFMIFTLVYYAVLYFFLYALTKNKALSLVGLFFVMGINTLFNYPVFPVSENYVWPGATVLRYFFDMAVFYIIYRNKDFISTRLNWIASALTAFAFFYNIETGVSLVIGFGSLILISAISKHGFSFRELFFDIVKKCIPLFVCFATLFGGFSSYTHIASGVWPDWMLFFRYIKLAQEGISNINTPIFGWYLIYLGLYFSVIIFVLNRIVVEKKKIEWKWIVLGGFSVYGLFLMNYYMSRSVFSNLTVVSIPGGILFFVLFSELSKRKEMIFSYIRAIFIIIIIFVTVLTSHYLVKRLKYRWYAFSQVRQMKKYPGNRGFIVVSYVEQKNFTAYDLLASVYAIKRLTKKEKKILLFSRFDTVILVMSEKTLALPLPMAEQIYYKSELKDYENQLIAMDPKPEYIFVDKKNPLSPPPTSYDGARELFEVIKPFYRYSKSVGVFDIYTLKNGL